MDVSRDEMVGLKLFPVFKVANQSADYPTQPDEWVVNVPETKRAPRSGYNRGDWEFGTDTYSCVEHGWEEPVDDVEVKLYARYFDAEAQATKRAVGILLRVLNKEILDLCQNTSTFTVHNVTNEWDDASNATPASDVNTGIETIEAACGVLPNTLVIALSTRNDLRMADDVKNAIKYTYGALPGRISAELLAEYFDVDRVVVSREAYNAAKEGASDSMTKQWSSEYAFLCHSVEGQDLMMPQVGRTFMWTEESPDIVNVESYYNDDVRSTIVRARNYRDVEVIWTAAAYLLGNITT